MILKSNMVVPGLSCPTQEVAAEVAIATTRCLQRAAPAAVAGIAFLSGGQSAELACARLNAIHTLPEQRTKCLPWPLSFSFGRALQQPALRTWAGTPLHRVAAQEAVLHRARCIVAALRGAYNPAMEIA
jgi:fructose-bisphosphate aldolase class I